MNRSCLWVKSECYECACFYAALGEPRGASGQLISMKPPHLEAVASIIKHCEQFVGFANLLTVFVAVLTCEVDILRFNLWLRY
jgi:hypothetical protein